MLKKLEAQLTECLDQPDKRQMLLLEKQELLLNLAYIKVLNPHSSDKSQHFPKDRKYLSLFPKGEAQPEMVALRDEIKAQIRARRLSQIVFFFLALIVGGPHWAR